MKQWKLQSATPSLPSRADDICLGGSTFYVSVAKNLHHMDVD